MQFQDKINYSISSLVKNKLVREILKFRENIMLAVNTQ